MLLQYTATYVPDTATQSGQQVPVDDKTEIPHPRRDWVFVHEVAMQSIRECSR